MSRPVDRPRRLLVLGAEAPAGLSPAFEVADTVPEAEVRVEAVANPASRTGVGGRLSAADCVLVTEAARDHVREADAPTPPVVLLVEEFSTEMLREGLEVAAEAFLPREALSREPELVAQRVGEVLATGADAAMGAGQEYKEVFDGVNDAIAVHDPETGEMIDVNATMCELTGYDRETVLRKGAEGLLVDAPESDFPTRRVPEVIGRVAAGESVDPYEAAVRTSDGERVWLEVNPTRATIAGEDRVLAISRDVTERKRREREYEQIFDGVNDAISVHDPETGEILRANESYLELLGYDSVDRLQALGIGGLSATEEGYTAEAGRQLIREVGRQEMSTTVEWRVKRADGERLWVEATLTPGEVGGEPRVLSMHRDVTERKRREQQLAVFNRVLRHNLRNRVDVIRSHAETLRDPEKEATEHARQIIENADHLATLGSQVRDADRLLNREARLRPVDLSETVQAVVDEVADVGTDVTVRTALTPATVRTDEEALRLVLESALDNAVEYAVEEVVVRVERTADGCAVQVEDDGPGIPADELETLESGTESMLQHSRGLGLWRIRWGTDLLNGRLSFDTEDGTTVTVTLPDRETGAGG